MPSSESPFDSSLVRVAPPACIIFFNFSFSSCNSLISLSVGLSLTFALVFICFARSAVKHDKIHIL